MYRNHRIILILVFFCTFLFTYLLKYNYKNVTDASISIVSIALAVYAISLSSLIGSPLVQQMQKTQDVQIKHKSQLGVIKEYIYRAMFISIITLILNCLVKVSNLSSINIPIVGNFLRTILEPFNLKQMIFSICFGFFSLNFVFIWIIFVFILNKQIN